MDGEYEVIVIGGGAAGLSAALILGRSRRRVLVCDEGRPRNRVSGAVHGFLSREGIDPHELLSISRAQIERYPSVGFHDTRVCGANVDEGQFVIVDDQGKRFKAVRLLLATGMYDELPSIEGLSRFWGNTAFVCPYCDAWEFSGKAIGIIGKGDGRANWRTSFGNGVTTFASAMKPT